MSVRSKLPRPLQIVFRPAGPSPAHPNAPDPASDALAGLTIYAGDSLASGQLALTADRVTDLMNDHASFEFVDTSVQSLEDGHSVFVHDVLIERSEIFAVAVAGNRGDPSRRIRTRPMAVQVRLGPYEVRGNLHGHPGSDPIAGFTRRGIMVPLTEATIEYIARGRRASSRFETILVNRLLTDSISISRGVDVRPPELPIKQGGRLLKDFSFELTVR